MVLRVGDPLRAQPLLESLQQMGVLHVEIAWSEEPHWSDGCAELIRSFPALRLGAASLCTPRAVEQAAAAGFPWGFSPILERSLLRRAGALGMALVPGVMTPSEVHRARRWGCRVVKLFPAAAVGADYWRRLREPLCAPLPRCIAAGGIAPAEVPRWLAGGVDAVALGGALTAPGGGDGSGIDTAPLRTLLATWAR